MFYFSFIQWLELYVTIGLYLLCWILFSDPVEYYKIQQVEWLQNLDASLPYDKTMKYYSTTKVQLHYINENIPSVAFVSEVHDQI